MSENDKSEPLPAEEAAAESAPAAADLGTTETLATPAANADGNGGNGPNESAAARGKRTAAWTVIVLVLLAAALAGYWLVSTWRESQETRAAADDVSGAVASQAGQLDAIRGAVDDLRQRIVELEAQDPDAETLLAGIDSAIEQRVGMLDSLPPRMADLENSVAALQGVSAASRDTWLLAEAEYFMQIANSQLQLAGNPGLAVLALGMADERVTQIGDPGLTEVRRTLANELAALEAMGKPDIEGATLTLASLARVIDSLPLRSDGADAGAPVDTQDESSRLSRAWNSVKGAFAGLVRITPPQAGTRPLLTPQAEYFLRTNITLQLQAARLALLRGEQAVFEQSLDDAASWLVEYFDADSAPVESALETIAELRSERFAVAAPDISGSLRLLRQYRTRTGGAQ